MNDNIKKICGLFAAYEKEGRNGGSPGWYSQNEVWPIRENEFLGESEHEAYVWILRAKGEYQAVDCGNASCPVHPDDDYARVMWDGIPGHPAFVGAYCAHGNFVRWEEILPKGAWNTLHPIVTGRYTLIP